MKHSSSGWAVDGRNLPKATRLADLLQFSESELRPHLDSLVGVGPVIGELVAPIDEDHEVWACGVTYLRSRDAREAESATADVYSKVYAAERPEIFYKSTGWRVVGPGGAIRMRSDSAWNVPEPELTLVVNRQLEIVGYTVGNDVSSRSIEGENPLYLPQAKCYDGSCAIGPAIQLCTEKELGDLQIFLKISREGKIVFEDSTSITQMKRSLPELVSYLGRETSFPLGVFVMTGTGIIPPPEFTLRPRDEVTIVVGELELVNVCG